MSDENTAPVADPKEETPAPENAAPDFTPVATLDEEDLKQMDELQEKEAANDRTLRVALGHHSTVKKGLQHEMGDWWKALGEKHGFDPASENFVLLRGKGDEPDVIARAADVEHMRQHGPQG